MASVSIETGLAVAAVAGGVVGAVCILGALLLEPATVINLLLIFKCVFWPLVLSINRLGENNQTIRRMRYHFILSGHVLLGATKEEKNAACLSSVRLQFFFPVQYPLKILIYSSILQHLT